MSLTVGSVDASYPLLGLLVALGALGIPFPLSLALAAAGALARQGQMSLLALLALCTGAAVAGDCLGYAIGRYGIAAACARLHGRLCSWLNRTVLERGRSDSERRLGMGLLVFLTRWAITAPSAVVNLLAGARRYRWEEFLVADFAGEAIWAAVALLEGYLLGGDGGTGLALALAGGALLALVMSGVAAPVRRRDPHIPSIETEA